MCTTGGVEDTRLEAKVKDTKKTLRPRLRTDSLEAKTKDQGHRRKCSPKTNGVQKFFSDEKGLKTKFFSRSLIAENKKGQRKCFSRFWRFPTRFHRLKKLCCLRAEDRVIFEDFRFRGQGLDLRGQGQGLQNVSSRTPPLTGA